jgi:hypothetical protein
MTTERQIASNQRNAAFSTGPRTTQGKTTSRANAIKHGLAAQTLMIDGLQAGFAGRKAEWEQDIKPTTTEGHFALDAVVACTFRIEECRRSINARLDRDSNRACLIWDLDREADVALLASKLAKQPELVSRQLKASKHGVELILRVWVLLGASLETKQGAWSDAEISTAFDLLGIPSHLRDGRAPFDPRGGDEDVYQSRRAFILSEGDRLRARESELARLDRRDREQAETGTSLLGTKPMALLLRYESASWRRYDTMLKAAKLSAQAEVSKREVESGHAFAASEAAFAAEVQAMIDSDPEGKAAMEADEEGDEEYAFPNEPRSTAVASRPLNRHQRRKQASKARKG